MVPATTAIAIFRRRQRDSEVDDSVTARTRSPAEIISEGIHEGSTASLGRISPAPIDGVSGTGDGSECSADDSADLPNCDANPPSGRTRKRSAVNRGAGRGAASGAIEECRLEYCRHRRAASGVCCTEGVRRTHIRRKKITIARTSTAD